jgi:ABC-2 type transport system ATP-binding protein
MNNEKVITAEKLSKRFGDFTAVDEITFEVNRGEIFGFLGANGAGKLRLCGCSADYHFLHQVRLVLLVSMYKENEKIKKNIGYMSQKFSLYEDLTVRETSGFTRAFTE